MRVGINATSLDGRPSGARQRFIGLYGALFRATPATDYLIYEPRDCRVADWFADLPNVRGIATPLAAGGRWQRLVRGLGYWRARLARDRLDLFETLHLPLVRAPRCPTIMTVHDARAGLPDARLPGRLLYRQMLRRSLRRASRVITVSDTMRAELLRYHAGTGIETIYNGIDPQRFIAPVAPLPAGIAAPYLLAVGHFEPRKNYATLVAAFATLRADHPDLDLVIVGKDGGTLAETRETVRGLGLGGHVHLLHAVDDATLATLYAEARLLIFASTYEGFGIPVLEAMAAGTPMALSALPVFRELTQDQAPLFDPLDPTAMAQVIAKTLAAPGERERQRHYGAARIADFTFPTLAAKLHALHAEVVAAASSPPAPRG